MAYVRKRGGQTSSMPLNVACSIGSAAETDSNRASGILQSWDGEGSRCGERGGGDGAILQAISQVRLSRGVYEQVHAHFKRISLGFLRALLPVNGQVRRRMHPQEARAVAQGAQAR